MTDCLRCGKPTNKLFVVGDDLENPRPYHKDCIEKLTALAEIKWLEKTENRRRW